MSALRQACATGRARHTQPATRCAVQRAAERLADRPIGTRRALEGWEALLARVDPLVPAALRQRDLKRLLVDMWHQPGLEEQEHGLLHAGVARDRKSVDRAIVESYLRWFPLDRPAFADLQGASRLVAERRDWPWRERGRRLELWDGRAGPRRLSEVLLAAERPAAVLREAGLDGDLATGAYVRAAVKQACLKVATQDGAEAVTGGARLLALAETMRGAEGLDGPLALALLAPWTRATPPAEHQRLVMGRLSERIGDPRIKPAIWAALADELGRQDTGVEVAAAFDVLRRWLVRTSVRDFFDIIARTTDRPDQWADRRAFWESYLDAGHITDAWFALGSQAGQRARRFFKDGLPNCARLEGSGATATQSALLMRIGDLQMAEWSDNGSCRFWPVQSRGAPPMYQSVHYAAVLRTMNAEPGCAPLAHQGVGTWQKKFARRVYERTGVSHPQHGQGW